MIEFPHHLLSAARDFVPHFLFLARVANALWLVYAFFYLYRNKRAFKTILEREAKELQTQADAETQDWDYTGPVNIPQPESDLSDSSEGLPPPYPDDGAEDVRFNISEWLSQLDANWPGRVLPVQIQYYGPVRPRAPDAGNATRSTEGSGPKSQRRARNGSREGEERRQQ